MLVLTLLQLDVMMDHANVYHTHSFQMIQMHVTHLLFAHQIYHSSVLMDHAKDQLTCAHQLKIAL
jgi:hypothetical protein